MSSENGLVSIDLDWLHTTCDLILNNQWVPEDQKGKSTAMLHLALGQSLLAQDGFQFLYVTDSSQLNRNYKTFLAMLAANTIPHCVEPNAPIVRTWSQCRLDWYGNREYVGVQPWQSGHVFWFVDFQAVQNTIQPNYKFASIFIDVDHYWLKVGKDIINNLKRNVVEPSTDIYIG